MAAMPSPKSGPEDALLVSQCLDFCQTLAGKSITFSFSLTTRAGFSFSVDSRGKGALAPKKKKKATPSTMRRNARRRAQFLKKKLDASTVEKSSQGEPAAVNATEAPPKAPALPSPEKERGSPRSPQGSGFRCPSPIHVQREEVQDQEGTFHSLREVGTQMCPVCDFEMCFPILDRIDISCKCLVGEDS